jgi:hypothetical protein
MNTITIKTETSDGCSCLEIEIDGKRLAHHFAGRLGAHPSRKPAVDANSIMQMLGMESSPLSSGRIPLLLCEECGDIGCGGFAVRISFEAGTVRWSDWATENGREPASPIEWPTKPGDYEFDRSDYENELRRALKGLQSAKPTSYL